MDSTHVEEIARFQCCETGRIVKFRKLAAYPDKPYAVTIIGNGDDDQTSRYASKGSARKVYDQRVQEIRDACPFQLEMFANGVAVGNTCIKGLSEAFSGVDLLMALMDVHRQSTYKPEQWLRGWRHAIGEAMETLRAQLSAERLTKELAAQEWHTLDAKTSARVKCSAWDCDEQATECLHNPIDTCGVKSISFSHYCARHAEMVKTTGTSREK